MITLSFSYMNKKIHRTMGVLWEWGGGLNPFIYINKLHKGCYE